MRHAPAGPLPSALALALLAGALAVPWAGVARAQRADAVWDLLSGPVNPQPMYGHRAVHDPLRHRMLLLDLTRPRELWSVTLPASGPVHWTRVPIRGTSFPPARRYFSAVCDSLRDRILVYGGRATADNTPLGDVWALSLGDEPEWTPIVPQGDPPSARAAHAAVLDPGNDRMVVFGGSGDGGFLGDTWVLELSGEPTWRMLTPDGLWPSPRLGATAVYDPWYSRMVLFGGWYEFNGTGRILDDTYTLALAGDPVWRPRDLSPRPHGRHDHVAVVDPVSRRMIVTGGDGWEGDYEQGDVWALTLGRELAWTRLTPAGTTPAIAHQAAVTSPERGSLIEYGALGPNEQDEFLELDLGTLAWARLMPDSPAVYPPPRNAASLLVTPGDDSLLMYGGYWYHDLWSFDLAGNGGWSQLEKTGIAPWCGASSFVFDPVRRRWLGFGGRWWLSRPMDQVWELPLTEPRVWTQLAPQGTPPIYREGFSLIYDPLRDRVLLFGGAIHWRPTFDCGDSQDELWELSLGDTLRWTRLTTTGTPGARDGHTAIYDPIRDRMLVLGGEFRKTGPGYYCDIHPVNDAWTLSLGGDSLVWSPLGPDVPEQGGTVLDPLRDRLLIWPGNDWIWSLSLSDPQAWARLSTAGVPPSPRASTGSSFDAGRDRMVMFGGNVFGGNPSPSPAADLYALRFSRAVAVQVGAGTHESETPVGSRGSIEAAILADASFSPDSVLPASVTLGGAHAIGETRWRRGLAPRDVNHDGRRDLLLTFPADSIRLAPGDSIALLMGDTPHFAILGRARLGAGSDLPRMTGPSAPGGAGRGLGLIARSPARSGLELSIALADASPARLEVFDVAGRRMLSRECGALEPGTHDVTLETGSLSPGVYLVRLRQGARAVVTRTVVLR